MDTLLRMVCWDSRTDFGFRLTRRSGLRSYFPSSILLLLFCAPYHGSPFAEREWCGNGAGAGAGAGMCCWGGAIGIFTRFMGMGMEGCRCSVPVVCSSFWGISVLPGVTNAGSEVRDVYLPIYQFSLACLGSHSHMHSSPLCCCLALLSVYPEAGPVYLLEIRIGQPFRRLPWSRGKGTHG